MSTDKDLLHPDDPRLTAYAVGELDAAEQARVEAYLATSAEARETVADIRAITASLTAAYDEERARFVAEPANVIPVPAARWIGLPPWLAVAASLILGGLAAGLWLPPARTPSLATREAASVDASSAAFSSGVATAPVVAPPPAPKTSDSREAAATPALADNPPTSDSFPAVDAEMSRYRGENDKKAAAAMAPPTDAPGLAAPRSALAQAKTRVALAKARQAGAAVPDVAARGAPGTSAPASAALAAAAPPRAGNAPEALDSTKATGGAFASSDKMMLSREAGSSAKEVSREPGAHRENGNYELVRRLIESGQFPPAGSVDPGELLNHFPSVNVPPARDGAGLAIHLEAATCPWNEAHRLLRITLQAAEVESGVTLDVTFNPAVVSSYRQFGNGQVSRQWSTAPTGRLEVGPLAAGEERTVLYEAALTEMSRGEQAGTAPAGGVFASADIRSGDPEDRKRAPGAILAERNARGRIENATADFRWSAAVAAFALGLQDHTRASPDLFRVALTLANGAQLPDPASDRGEFVRLLQCAEDLRHDAR